jgi:hypothetical protein
MPILTYSAIGNWNDINGSFRNSRCDIEESHKIILNDKAVKKIKNKWNKVPYNFNFWFVNSKVKHTRFFIESVEHYLNNSINILKIVIQIIYNYI